MLRAPEQSDHGAVLSKHGHVTETMRREWAEGLSTRGTPDQTASANRTSYMFSCGI